MSEPALSAADLAYQYPDGRDGVRSVSLSVSAHGAVGVIGPNGAGKTTLFLLLAGLLRPARGELRIFGTRYDDTAGPEVRRRLGLVFQQTEDQLFHARVFDDVAFGPLNFGTPRSAVAGRVERALASVGLSGFAERVPHHLSAGERRRVGLATVFAYDPDVLILDEPTSDLDPRGRRELVDLLRSSDHAKLIASHDLEFVLKTCDRVLLLDEGKLVADGDASQILSDEKLLAAHGLEAPLGLAGKSAAELRALVSGDAPVDAPQKRSAHPASRRTQKLG